MVTNTDKLKLLYIMGAGRSGSTIFGILLGNMPCNFYAGELHMWNLHSGNANNDRIEVKAFWERVKLEMPVVENYYGNKYYKYLEYHNSFLFCPWLTKKKLISEYHEFNRQLISSIKKVANKEYVIDSSHYPFRALWLSKNKNIDTHFIYLYRHPFNVVESFSKKNIEHKSKNPVSANIYLFFVTLLSLIVYFILPKGQKTKIRYEDVVTSPELVINKFNKLLNAQNTVIDFSRLNIGYVFQSNRIRHFETIALKPKESTNKLNLFWKFFTVICQFPFLLINKRIKNI
ncbi:MAG TPA: sulfotransferase [Ignavibacteriaceae bacterium]|nr:sulfotransferase [Ignavibacteriaceae bacterium]